MLLKIKNINLKNHLVSFFFGSFTLGVAANVALVNYAIDWDKVQERIIELTKSAYLKGCMTEGGELAPHYPHFTNCHMKAEFYSPEVRMILYQDPKTLKTE